MKKKIDELTKILSSEIISNIGLLTGVGGQILVCSELFLLKKNQHDWLFDLNVTLEKRLANEKFTFTHCDGLAGIGWLYEYLSQKNVINYDTNLLLEEFDNCLVDILKVFTREANYDFLHGGVGVALYFAKRVIKKKEFFSVLNQFLKDLEKISIKQDDGTVKWNSFLGEHIGKWGYSIVLSHGMASIVAILSKLYKLVGIDKAITESLLRGTVKYIFSQEIDKEKYGCYFPNFAIESTPIINKSRLAWCYGDLGIASAIYQAGITLKENAWINKALEILIFAATKRRDLQANFVQDAGLCHGTVGIGHIFYRMWWNTKLSEFKDAADYWFEQTLKMANFVDGFAGYKTFEAPDGKPMWKNDLSFLTGISGIGMAMHTYYYEMEPVWDECLLLS